MIDKTDKIFIAGHKGLIGSSIVKVLTNAGYKNLVYETHNNLDLLSASEVRSFLKKTKPDIIFFAAGKVGGIEANIKYPANFIYENSLMQLNIIHQSYRLKIKKLLIIGSSCVYPSNIPRPILENDLLTAPLENTNESYALAKILGMKLSQAYSSQYQSYNLDYRSVVSTNAYGINDRFNTKLNHVIPALIQKIHTAKIKNEDNITIWGSGKPVRDFLYSDDVALACLHVMNIDKKSFFDIVPNNIINIGSGREHTISSLVEIISFIIGYKGSIQYDKSKPDGMPMKVLDIHLLKKTGWKPTISLEEGITMTYNYYLKNIINDS